MECSPPRFSLWNSPGKNIGVGCHFFLQEIFTTQGSNSGLLHCRQILYRLNHQGNPKVRMIFPKLQIWSWNIAFSPSPPLLSLQPFHCLWFVGWGPEMRDKALGTHWLHLCLLASHFLHLHTELAHRVPGVLLLSPTWLQTWPLLKWWPYSPDMPQPCLGLLRMGFPFSVTRSWPNYRSISSAAGCRYCWALTVRNMMSPVIIWFTSLSPNND